MIETIHSKHFLYPPPPQNHMHLSNLPNFFSLVPPSPRDSWVPTQSVRLLSCLRRTWSFLWLPSHPLSSQKPWCGDLERTGRKAYMRRHASLSCPLWDRFHNTKHSTINPVVAALCKYDHYHHKRRKVTGMCVYQWFPPLLKTGWAIYLQPLQNMQITLLQNKIRYLWIVRVNWVPPLYSWPHSKDNRVTRLMQAIAL